MIPGLRTFLDIDDLTEIGDGALEKLVDATDVIVVFLAGSVAADGTEQSDYMRRWALCTCCAGGLCRG